MQRALYEYAMLGVKTNIPFHQAVMGNGRFARGELGTHFLEREVGLLDDMRRIAESGEDLGEELSLRSDDRRKIAAIAAVAAMAMEQPR
jgi:pyruvate carboxylase subunit A